MKNNSKSKIPTEFTHFTWMDEKQYRMGLAKLKKKVGLSQPQIKIVVLS
jgi:hypothetical protein